VIINSQRNNHNIRGGKSAKHICLIGIFYILCSIYPAATVAQKNKAHFIKTFSIDEGLNQRIVNNIIRDNQGRFWIKSEEGIQFYNGSGFTNPKALDIINWQQYPKINLLNNGKICTNNDTSYYLIDPIGLEIEYTRLNNHEKLFVSNGELCKYNDQERSITWKKH